MSDFDYDTSVNPGFKKPETDEKFVVARDRDGKTVKMEGESTIFDLVNQKSFEVGYTGVKTGSAGFNNAQLKDGGKYEVEWGYIEVTGKDGKKQKIKNIEFDTDGDGIADTRYKVSDLQNGKIKARKIKHDSEYFNKKLIDALQETDIEKRNRKLEKLRKKMIKAGISEEVIDSKMGDQKPEIKSIAFVNRNESFFKVPEADLPTISKKAVEQQRVDKITELMEKYNKAVQDYDVHEAQKIINEIAQINLSDENKELIRKLCKSRNPLTTIEYIQSNNEYDRTLKETNFAQLDKTLEGLKGLPNYEQIVRQYESIKADALRRGYNPS